MDTDKQKFVWDDLERRDYPFSTGIVDGLLVIQHGVQHFAEYYEVINTNFNGKTQVLDPDGLMQAIFAEMNTFDEQAHCFPLDNFFREMAERAELKNPNLTKRTRKGRKYYDTPFESNIITE